jgi:hypothetical protein
MGLLCLSTEGVEERNFVLTGGAEKLDCEKTKFDHE